MKDIIIGFSRPRQFKLHAYLIMLCENAPYDHAYLKFRSASLERDIIYQAVGKGVQFIGNKLFEAHSLPVEEFKLSVEDTQYNKMMQFCIDNAGIAYSILEIIGLAISRLGNKMGVIIKNPFSNEDKKEFCSEIVSRCLNVVKPEEFNIDAANITPKELNTLLKTLKVERVL